VAETSSTLSTAIPSSATSESFLDKINAQWHKPALLIYAGIVLAHWAEHLTQAFQIYVLEWPVPESRGVLGLWFPWLVRSELLHYGYAIIMLIGLWVLRRGFVGRSYVWWMISFWIQFWHHIEHALLQDQAIAGKNFGDSPVPISIAQFWIPRVELHLFYNTIVFIPMAIAMYYHMFPPPGEKAHANCNCAWTPKPKRKTA
jgi:hypothetical protein